MENTRHGAVSQILADEMREKARREIDDHPLYVQLTEKFQTILGELKAAREKIPYSFEEYSVGRIKAQNEQRPFVERMGNAALGLPGEVGEIVEHLKKWFYHGKELDREYLLKELGDVLWYVNFMATTLGFTLEEVARANEEKLNKRYPNGFSVEEAAKL